MYCPNDCERSRGNGVSELQQQLFMSLLYLLPLVEIGSLSHLNRKTEGTFQINVAVVLSCEPQLASFSIRGNLTFALKGSAN